MRTIAIHNSKGGCGKTTVSTNLAACLGAMGERTLLVDLDAQGHCALGLGVGLDRSARTVSDLLDGSYADEVAALVRWAGKGLDLIPADLRLDELRQRSGFHFSRLSAALDQVSRQYSYCILDCAGSMDALSRAALEIANEVVVPVATGCVGLMSLGTFLPVLNGMKNRVGQQVKFRLLPTMHRAESQLARETLGELRARYGSRVTTTTVHLDDAIAEATGVGQPVTQYDPACPACQDFIGLAKELLSGTTAVSAETLASKAQELLAMAERQLGPSTRRGNRSLAEKLRLIYGVRQSNGVVQFTAQFREAGDVKLAGDFNYWCGEPLTRNAAGDWQLQLALKPGRYRYRYIVDGQWVTDPCNVLTEPNEFGEQNNLVEVAQTSSAAAVAA